MPYLDFWLVLQTNSEITMHGQLGIFSHIFMSNATFFVCLLFFFLLLLLCSVEFLSFVFFLFRLVIFNYFWLEIITHAFLHMVFLKFNFSGHLVLTFIFSANIGFLSLYFNIYYIIRYLHNIMKMIYYEIFVPSVN